MYVGGGGRVVGAVCGCVGCACVWNGDVCVCVCVCVHIIKLSLIFFNFSFGVVHYN